MQTAGQDLFRAILRLAKATVKPSFSDMGVTLTWDLENLELSGTFRIPVDTAIDITTGEYIITSQDFADDPPAAP
jgi:hypothetical protein